MSAYFPKAAIAGPLVSCAGKFLRLLEFFFLKKVKLSIGYRYGEAPFRFVKTEDIQVRVRNGLRLDQPEGLVSVE